MKNFLNYLVLEIFPKNLRFQYIKSYSKKYRLIYLLKIFSVSKSWYYKFLRNENNFKNLILEEKIKNICLKFNRKYWYRRITMYLKNIENISINHKKVLKMMRYNWILAKIRRKSNISFWLKKSLESKICKNILNRDFYWKPYEKFGTDISYLKTKNKTYFLSILKDFTTSEIISYEVSENLWLNFVLNTIRKARRKINLKWSIIHSDQWAHYRNYLYQNLLKKYWVKQSMSRRWNCLDNAPTESFFWHLKDEVNFKNISSFDELKKVIDDYIYFYNNKRFQWDKNKMTPVDFRNHFTN